MSSDMGEILQLYTKCVNFAAIKHRDQRRLDPGWLN